MFLALANPKLSWIQNIRGLSFAMLVCIRPDAFVRQMQEANTWVLERSLHTGISISRPTSRMRLRIGGIGKANTAAPSRSRSVVTRAAIPSTTQFTSAPSLPFSRLINVGEAHAPAYDYVVHHLPCPLTTHTRPPPSPQSMALLTLSCPAGLLAVGRGPWA